MSFADHITTAMAKLDPTIHLRLFGGPSSPANHSYALYQRDRGGPSRVVILAVLGSSVRGLVTNNGATWMFEGPAPFTYPRYIPGATGLVAEWPMVRTLDEYRAMLADPAAWDSYVNQLRATDGFYNRFLFRRDVGDHSAIVRMVRRAVAQRWRSARAAQIHGPSGFVPDSPAIASLQGIVAEFAATARRDGKLPIALLIEDRGYGDHVERILGPALQARDPVPEHAHDRPRHRSPELRARRPFHAGDQHEDRPGAARGDPTGAERVGDQVGRAFEPDVVEPSGSKVRPTHE